MHKLAGVIRYTVITFLLFWSDALYTTVKLGAVLSI